EAGGFHGHVVGSGRKGGKTVEAGSRSLGGTLATGCRLRCRNFGSGDQRAGGVGHGAIDGGAAALLGYRCPRTQQDPETEATNMFSHAPVYRPRVSILCRRRSCQTTA